MTLSSHIASKLVATSFDNLYHSYTIQDERTFKAASQGQWYLYNIRFRGPEERNVPSHG
jgi:hypothetical protein